ncbi:MAG: lysylphosphatidylglycerol synthase transmembrane domain-containing protein, partial [Persicimonas sp.]
MGTLEKRIVWGVVFGAVVYAGIALVADVRALGEVLFAFDPWMMVAALGLSVANYGCRFIKWHAYLRRIEVRLGLGESLNVFLAGMVMSVTPGKFGEVLKSLLLKERHGLAVSRTAPVVVTERLTDLLGLIVMAGVGLTVFDYGRQAFVVVTVVVFASLLVLHRPRLVEAFLDALEA